MKRKVLTLLLALVLCMGMSVPAFAATPKVIPSITINVPGGTGLTATLTNVYADYFAPASVPRSERNAEIFNGNYLFYFADTATVSFNQDVMLSFDSARGFGDENNPTLKAREVHNLDHYVGIYLIDGKVVSSVSEALTFDWDAKRDKNAVIDFTFIAYGEWAEASDDYNFDKREETWNTPRLSLSDISVNASTPAPTTDTPSSWAVESVNSAIAASIVPEALQSKYTTATTRAEFCALAVALYETVTGAEITERATFSDTTDVNVEKMAALGVVSGVGDNKFAPDSKLTREQAATMLSRLADAIGKPLTEQVPAFADNDSISSWAFDAVGQMQATSIMGGVGNNTFSPATDYTREQSIITIMRLFDRVK